MLEDSRYEETLAATTLRLVHSDLHTQLSSALRGARRAVRPSADSCAVCGAAFLRAAVVVFPCGHPVHEWCSDTCQCPVCATIAIDRVSNCSDGAAVINPETFSTVHLNYPSTSSPETTKKLKIVS